MRKFFLLFFFSMSIAMSYSAQYSGTCGQQLTWQLDTETGKLLISGTGEMYNYSPDTRPPWYPYRNNLKTAVIENQVTSVGNYAFDDMQNMTNVSIGNSVARLGNHAFSSTRSLTELIMPNSVSKIEENVCNYSAIEKLDLSDGIDTIPNYAFSSCQNLTQVILPIKLKAIEQSAFDYCTSLSEINLPETLEKISWWVFSHTAIKNIYIPASVNDIYVGIFSSCSDLETISVAAGNTRYDSRNNCNAVIETATNNLITGAIKTIIPTSVSRIEQYAFSGRKIESIVIPEGVLSIGGSAFQDCEELKTVTFPSTVTDCNSAFNNCTALTHSIYNSHVFARLQETYSGAYIMPQVETIANDAFLNCKTLTQITIGEGITTIPGNCFNSCQLLQEAILPSTLTNIDWYSFSNCQSLSSIDIPEGVKKIDGYAFSYCSSLESVSLPADLTNLGDNAFEYCTSLKQVNWNVRKINDYSEKDRAPFYNIRQNIEEFNFGDSVQYIPRYLCYGMSSLQSVGIGKNVSEMSLGTFEDCGGIKEVYWNARQCKDFVIYDYAPFYSVKDNIIDFTFGDDVEYIPMYLCYGMSGLETLHFTKNIRSIGNHALYGLSGLNSITVDSNNQYLDSRNNCNALIETASNNLLLGCKNTVIPNNIHSIGDYAFHDCKDIRNITLPEGLTTIGNNAFYGCTELDSIVLPNSLKTIGSYAFTNCTGLDYIVFGDGLEQIGMRAFNKCERLASVELQENIKRLADYAFSACTSMSSIILNAVVPPQIEISSFDVSCPINVPCEGLSAYRTANHWRDMQDRVRGAFEFSLTVSPNDISYGSAIITQNPNCENDAVAIVTATSYSGYIFDSWQDIDGNIISKDNPYQFTMTENLNLTAYFVRTTLDTENLFNQLQIVVEGNNVNILLDRDATITIFDFLGRCISSVNATTGVQQTVALPSAGMYILNAGGICQKVLIK